MNFPDAKTGSEFKRVAGHQFRPSSHLSKITTITGIALSALDAGVR